MGGLRSRRMTPDRANAARHRLARTTSCPGAAATAITWLGGRVGHDAAAVGDRLERVDERLRGGAAASSPRLSAAPQLLDEAVASTAAVAPKMPSSSEVSDSKETSVVAFDALRQRTGTHHACEMERVRAGLVVGGGLEARADRTTRVGDVGDHERSISTLTFMRAGGSPLFPSARPCGMRRHVDDASTTCRAHGSEGMG